MYSDKPRPTKGYLLFLLLALLGMLCIFAAALDFSHGVGVQRSILLFEGLALALPCVAICALLLILLYTEWSCIPSPFPSGCAAGHDHRPHSPNGDTRHHCAGRAALLDRG
jgi:hypothetical protein